MKTLYSLLIPLVLSGMAMAQGSSPNVGGHALFDTIQVILAGVFILVISATITDLMTPGNLVGELKKKNLALALVVAGSWIADAIILNSVLGGWSQADHSALFSLASDLTWNVILNAVIYALFGIFLRWLLYKLFDKFTPTLDFNVELQGQNVALGTAVAGLFIATAWLISGPLAG